LEEARRLLKEGAQRNPRDPAILQAWALLEAEQDNVEEARRLFKRASKADPKHLYVWQAWGCMEYRHQQYDTGERVCGAGGCGEGWNAPAGFLLL
jgi:predicted Zn-dependent protease